MKSFKGVAGCYRGILGYIRLDLANEYFLGPEVYIPGWTWFVAVSPVPSSIYPNKGFGPKQCVFSSQIL